MALAVAGGLSYDFREYPSRTLAPGVSVRNDIPGVIASVSCVIVRWVGADSISARDKNNRVRVRGNNNKVRGKKNRVRGNNNNRVRGKNNRVGIRGKNNRVRVRDNNNKVGYGQSWGY